MFKIIRLLAVFVVNQYQREAKRLHKVVVKVDSKRIKLVEEVDVLANELEREKKALEQKFSERRVALLTEMEKHDSEIDGHVNRAAAASIRANKLAEVLK
ncbi:hypothetical protein [Erwinia phage Zoomie]|uniref:Uncharacterized protein n=1 Tax=Erwinia phage Zoomie TaxID=2851072 RepID=A0A9E6T3P2_9CAUD|nr:hypothetical protein [Erwinia phage Zoomie]